MSLTSGAVVRRAFGTGTTCLLLLTPAVARSQGGAVTFEHVNVCQRVSGESVARAVAGRLVDARPVNVKDFASARCVYAVEIGGTRRAFVLWFNPPADYDGLREAAEKPVPVAGIGDAAHMTFDTDTSRYWLTAVARGKVALQATGERPEWVQALARLALSTF